MEIEFKEVTIRDLVEGYEDYGEDGVVGYGGKLDIRPPFQREFVYNEKQRNAVIDTVKKEFPLNVMYWALRENGDYEIIDGQQRTISICQYVDGDFSVDKMYFHSLEGNEKKEILDYPLMIYVCSGTDSDKLEWFKTINIAGEELYPQELRNAVYHGPWVTDAKRHFSKSNCPAYAIGRRYLDGVAIRQDYLETTIKWFNNSNNADEIEEFMSEIHHKPSANELWRYFQNVISWVESVFPIYRREMKGIPWGFLYNEFKDVDLDPDELDKRIIELMQEDDVTNKKGIYLYVLNGNEKHLNIRAFDNRERRQMYEKQEGICTICKEHFQIEEMHADHIVPWSRGGKTSIDNGQMLCRDCNLQKSAM